MIKKGMYILWKEWLMIYVNFEINTKYTIWILRLFLGGKRNSMRDNYLNCKVIGVRKEKHLFKFKEKYK